MLIVATTACGFIFGWGLLISGMMQPAKVIGFLDVLGSWDPSLAVVMTAALVISRTGFTLATLRKRPILASQSFWPTKTDIDRPLVIGATLFGVGWGLVGLCPGPALENLATFSPRAIAFVIAMALGMVLYDLWSNRSVTTPQREGNLRCGRRWISFSGGGPRLDGVVARAAGVAGLLIDGHVAEPGAWWYSPVGSHGRRRR